MSKLLTKRQTEVVQLAARGLANKEIGARLGLTEGTVKVYMCQARLRAGGLTRYELALGFVICPGCPRLHLGEGI
jgi:DNA-binding NarL/FixJ family response regulator